MLIMNVGFDFTETQVVKVINLGSTGGGYSGMIKKITKHKKMFVHVNLNKKFKIYVILIGGHGGYSQGYSSGYNGGYSSG